MERAIRRKVLVVLLLITGVVLSAAVHEFGHAGAAKLVGGDVISVQPWCFHGKAHCNLAGIATNAQLALVSVSGMLLTVLAGITGALLVSFGAGRIPQAKIGVWLFVPMLFQSLAWFFLPPLLMLGFDWPSDDIVVFIRSSGWHPLLVACFGFCLSVLSGGILVWIYTGAPAGEGVKVS